MKEIESPGKVKNPAAKVVALTAHPPTLEQLQAMSTNELVKMMMS